MSNKAKLILHPVRMRIVTEIAGRHMTSQQLATVLSDVPQATLYRHIRQLHNGGILEVIAEQSVNGATERTYAVVQGGARLSPEEVAQFTASEHLGNFTLFMASLIDEFARYIEGIDTHHVVEEGMSYNRAVLYLNESERAQFQQQVIEFVGKWLSNPPSPDRQRFTLASIIIPDKKEQ